MSIVGSYFRDMAPVMPGETRPHGWGEAALINELARLEGVLDVVVETLLSHDALPAKYRKALTEERDA